MTIREFYFMKATGKYLSHEEIGKLVEEKIENLMGVKDYKKEEKNNAKAKNWG